MLDRQVDNRDYARSRREDQKEGPAEKTPRWAAENGPNRGADQGADHGERRQDLPWGLGNRPLVVEALVYRPERQPQVMRDHAQLAQSVIREQDLIEYPNSASGVHGKPRKDVGQRTKEHSAEDGIIAAVAADQAPPRG